MVRAGSYELPLSGFPDVRVYTTPALSDEWQAGQHLLDRVTVGGGVEAHGHELSGVVRVVVALEHAVTPDTGGHELVVECAEVALIPSVERDGMTARLGLGIGRLTGGVDGLRDLQPDGEIGANDDVVSKPFRARAGTVLVNAAYPEHSHGLRTCQGATNR